MKIEDVELKSYLDYVNQDQISRMDEEQSKVMMSLIIGEMQGIELGEDIIGQDNGCRIIKSRLDRAGVKYSLACLIFCSFLCDSPGKAVMWAYTLFKMYQKEQEEITLNKLVESFPWGFPTDDSQRECWDAQKGYKLGIKVDNVLDSPESWGLKTW